MGHVGFESSRVAASIWFQATTKHDRQDYECIILYRDYGCLVISLKPEVIIHEEIG